MSKLISKPNQSGFTLIEMLIYIGIAGIILATISALLAASFTTRVKNTVIQEVELQGAQVTLQITQAIRRSEAVTSPTPGNQLTALTLDVGSDPEIYSDFGSVVHRTSGNPASALPVHSSSITVSGLNFRNVSRPDTPDSIEFEFTLTYVNTTGKNEYDYSKTFYGSASIYELGV